MTKKKHLKNTTNLKQNHEKQWSIYYLVCPYKNIVRYVGMSKDPQNRFAQHISQSDKMKKENPYKFNWIEKVKRKNMEPKLQIVLSNLTFDEAFLLEEAMIKALKTTHPKEITNIAPSNKPPVPKSKRIYKCDSEGNILKEYDGIRQAARKMKLSYGSISHCLAGRRKTCGGFIWRYAN